MSRFAKVLELEEFKSKMKTYINDEDEGFPYSLPSKVLDSDLTKINFDMENYCIGNADPSYAKYPSDHQGYVGYPCGYEVLENGLPVLFVNAGGDWEHPICFVLYWDGKGIRGYIPKDGNVYNVKEKCAYGNEESDEFLDAIDEAMTEGSDNPLFKSNPQKIRQDVMSRIQIR